MNLYIAGKYTGKDRLRGERELMRLKGFTVSSSWMDQPETDYTFEGATEEERLRRAISEAYRDTSEVRASDVLILDTQDESATGGREVELGMALMTGSRTILVGPVRNIFHHLADEHYLSWAELSYAMGQRLSMLVPKS